MDEGSARRLIRQAKADPSLCDIWGIDPEDLNDDPIPNEKLEHLGLFSPPETGPAILIYDIENTPGLAWVWGAYDQNVIAMERDWHLLSFAYKWLNSDEIGFVSIKQDPGFYPDTTDDSFVAHRLAALFDRADVVVAHNGDKFDKRKANARFLFWGIDPPSPYQSIDTLKIARREFSNYSNSLQELGRIHQLGAKVQNSGFKLWRDCMRGDDSAWEMMEDYNRQDVVLLELLYIKLLPWMGLPGKPSGINYGFWNKGKMVCPNCGHDHLTPDGVHRTLVSEFEVYRCERCRSLSRFRTRIPQTKDTALKLV